MNNKYRIFLILGSLFIVLSITAGIIWWWPAVLSYSDLRKSLESKDRELKEKTEYFAELNSDFNRIKNYQEQIAKIESAFPDDLDIAVPTLYNFIIGKTSENGVALKDVSVDLKSSKANTAGIEEISFRVSIEGSYPTMKNFITSLFRNTRMIYVNSIQFDSPQNKSSYGFGISFKTYSKASAVVESQGTQTAPEPEFIQ